jgi:hypothetical protein
LFELEESVATHAADGKSTAQKHSRKIQEFRELRKLNRLLAAMSAARNKFIRLGKNGIGQIQSVQFNPSRRKVRPKKRMPSSI